MFAMDASMSFYAKLLFVWLNNKFSTYGTMEHRFWLFSIEGTQREDVQTED